MQHQSRLYHTNQSLYYDDVNIMRNDIILGNETQKSQFHFEDVQFSTHSRSGRVAEAL